MVGVSYAYTLYVIINNLHSPFIPTLPSFKWQNRRMTLKSTSLLNPTIIYHFSNFAFSIRPCVALFNKRNDITFKVVKNPFKATFYQGSLWCILYWVVGVRFDLDIALKYRDYFWSQISYCMLSPIFYRWSKPTFLKKMIQRDISSITTVHYPGLCTKWPIIRILISLIRLTNVLEIYLDE